MDNHILQVNNLTTQFRTIYGNIAAVEDVSFHLDAGQTLGVVGESGSGKSTLALSLMRLIDHNAGKIVSGEVWLGEKNLLQLSPREMQCIRGNSISMIFQEPMTSLNPVFTVGTQIEEAILLHQNVTEKEARIRCLSLLERVGITAPDQRSRYYPHQLSGGMRQRIMIAMALACEPLVLIADEPTSALDVTIQAQILDLLKRLQKEMKMAVIFITHDLGVVSETCDTVMVMYCGRIVEKASVSQLFKAPAHHYTQGLIDVITPITSESNTKRLRTIEGYVPSLANLPVGCNFQERCKYVSDACRKDNPVLNELTENHKVACNHPNYVDTSITNKRNI